jgi:drug/metabolite transporter (DMT)-like permease
MQTLGTTALAVSLAALGLWPALEVGAVPWAIALAALGSGSLYLLYRGLALGPIAVVSPIVASYSALTVGLVVIFLGDRLSLEQAIAIAVVFLGVLLATADVRAIAASIRVPLPGVPISLVATLGFACWGTLFAAATRVHDGLTLVLLGRAFSIPMLVAAVLLTRAARPASLGSTTLLLVATVGAFDTLANVAFMLGVQGGQAAIAVTGSGLYPLLPAFLGIVRHGERLAPNQYLGIAIVVGGLVVLGLRG